MVERSLLKILEGREWKSNCNNRQSKYNRDVKRKPLLSKQGHTFAHKT